jgi:hypothetical protein
MKTHINTTEKRFPTQNSTALSSVALLVFNRRGAKEREQKLSGKASKGNQLQ